MPRARLTEIDHIDPRWREGRDYQLVCGFESCPLNLREVSRSENSWKNNKFLPWRWVRDEFGVVPTEPGDLALFLVGADIETDTPGEWVLMEFLSDEWAEAARKTCASSVARAGKPNPGVTAKAWETIRSDPEAYGRACKRLRQTAIDAWGNDQTRVRASQSQREAWDRRTPEERAEIFAKISTSLKGHPKLSEGGRRLGLVLFQCTVTGYVSNSGGLTKYQVVRGIDPVNRVELTPEQVENLPSVTPEEDRERKLKNRREAARVRDQNRKSKQS